MSEAGSTPSATTVKGWTPEQVLAHLLALREVDKEATSVAFTSQKTAIDAALAAADRAVQKAETATEKRFESVNEFRSQLGDQQRTFMPRSEVDLIEKRLSEKVDSALKQLNDMHAERLGVKGGWGYAVAVVMFMVALGSLVFAFIK